MEIGKLLDGRSGRSGNSLLTGIIKLLTIPGSGPYTAYRDFRKHPEYPDLIIASCCMNIFAEASKLGGYAYLLYRLSQSV